MNSEISEFVTSRLLFFRFAFIRVNPRLNFKLTHYVSSGEFR